MYLPRIEYFTSRLEGVRGSKPLSRTLGFRAKAHQCSPEDFQLICSREYGASRALLELAKQLDEE
jgi:hypothetical protein